MVLVLASSCPSCRKSPGRQLDLLSHFHLLPWLNQLCSVSLACLRIYQKKAWDLSCIDMVERDLTLHVLQHCPNQMSAETSPVWASATCDAPLTCRSPFAKGEVLGSYLHTRFLEGLADEENMNGLSPIIWSFVAPDDSCWFNMNCLVLEKEISGLAESWMQLDCESMLSRSGFAEEEGCTPTIMTQSKVFGMLPFSKTTYSCSRNWFPDSLSQMTKAPAHAVQKFSSFNKLCISLEFWEKEEHTRTHTHC